MAKSLKKSTKTVQNKFVTGISGKQRTSQVYVIDKGDGSIWAKTSGDIYMDAKKLFQTKSENTICRVKAKRVEQYGELVHHVKGNETSIIQGANEITVVKDQKIHVKQVHKLTVDNTQTVKVGKGQTIEVTEGIRKIDVKNGGELKEHITGDRTITVDGKNTVDVTSECKWIKKDHFYGFSFAAEEALKLSNSLGITAGAKEEGNIGLVESLNVSGGFEQNFGLKRVFSASIVKETCCGIKMGENKAIDLQKTNTMTKREEKIVDNKAAVFKGDSKLWKIGAKLWLFD